VISTSPGASAAAGATVHVVAARGDVEVQVEAAAEPLNVVGRCVLAARDAGGPSLLEGRKQIGIDCGSTCRQACP
jgi:hypothetical protein